MQRAIEQVGISTVGVSIAREISMKVNPPRTYFLKYPFGHPFGEPNNPKQHLRILEDCFDVLETAKEPGTLVESSYRWRRTKFD